MKLYEAVGNFCRFFSYKYGQSLKKCDAVSNTKNNYAAKNFFKKKKLFYAIINQDIH